MTAEKNEQDLHELTETNFSSMLLRGKKAKCRRVSIACYHLYKKEEIRKYDYFVKRKHKKGGGEVARERVLFSEHISYIILTFRIK